MLIYLRHNFLKVIIEDCATMTAQECCRKHVPNHIRSGRLAIQLANPSITVLPQSLIIIMKPQSWKIGKPWFCDVIDIWSIAANMQLISQISLFWIALVASWLQRSGPGCLASNKHSTVSTRYRCILLQEVAKSNCQRAVAEYEASPAWICLF